MPAHARMTTTIQPVKQIAPDARERMFELMSDQFENVEREQFERDLDEKDEVFMVASSDGRLEGFSTLVALHSEVVGKPIVGLFSGDTIIDPQHWGDRQFLRVVGQRLYELAGQWPDRKSYWLLLTCTFRSYRLISGVFEESTPRHDQTTSQELKAPLDALVSQVFPREYHPEQGIVILDNSTPVRPERTDVSDRHLDDPHVDFFVRSNPQYTRGDFLCCLTELVPSNLTPLGHRLLKL